MYRLGSRCDRTGNPCIGGRVGPGSNRGLDRLLDVSAKIARNEQRAKKLAVLIAGKESKLSNANFTARAPADVLAGERESLQALQEQLKSIQATLAICAAGSLRVIGVLEVVPSPETL